MFGYRILLGGKREVTIPFSTVSLLLHCNGSNGSTTIVDSSSNAFTVTANGNAQLSTSSPLFGSASLVMDGNGDFLSISHNSAFAFGAGDFTIEFSVVLNTVKTSTCIAQKRNTLSEWGLTLTDTGFVFFYWTTGQTYQQVDVATTWSTGVQYDCAVVRSGSTFTFYRNGVSLGSATNGTAIEATSEQVLIGRLVGFEITRDLDGKLDEFRITKGFAREIVAKTGEFPDA